MSKEKSNSPAPSGSPTKRASAKSRSSKTVASAVDSPAEDAAALVEDFEISSPVISTVVESDPWDESQISDDHSSEAPPQKDSKRKRRRRKGKGGSVAQTAAPSGAAGDEQSIAPAEDSTARPPRPTSQPVRAKVVDPESVSKLARKIYLAEISEEGVALIGDNDARELSRRCFRLAEIFIEEQARRS